MCNCRSEVEVRIIKFEGDIIPPQILDLIILYFILPVV